jgi:putative redox protein
MVSAELKSGLVAQVAVRAHRFEVGVGEASGGHDEGPDPHELLEASLATCAALTAQLYAQRKGFKLESTRVKVQILQERPEVRIGVEVEFRGELTPAEKARLNEIVARCPIHRLLEAPAHIETKML